MKIFRPYDGYLGYGDKAQGLQALWLREEIKLCEAGRELRPSLSSCLWSSVMLLSNVMEDMTWGLLRIDWPG